MPPRRATSSSAWHRPPGAGSRTRRPPASATVITRRCSRGSSIGPQAGRTDRPALATRTREPGADDLGNRLRQHRQDVAGRVREPSDRRPVLSLDALLVLRRALVALELDAPTGQLVHRRVDVLDREPAVRLGLPEHGCSFLRWLPIMTRIEAGNHRP